MSSEIKELGELKLDIIDGDRGKNYPHKDELWEYGYCLFLSAGNVTNNGFAFSNNQFITLEKDKILRNGKLRRNDIVITTRGTVGNVGFYNSSVPYENVRINSGMLIVRCSGEDVVPEYLYNVLRSKAFKMQIKSIQTGSAQPQLPKSHFSKMMISVPDIETQKKIAGTINVYDEKIKINEQINENLAA